MMGFANSLLLKEAVPLLAVRYCNSSFAGSVLAWLVNQLSSENWQSPFSCWVSFLLGYWVEWACQRLGWVLECCKTLEGMYCWRWYWWEKTEELLIFSSLPTLGLIAHPVLQSLVFVPQSPCVILPGPSFSSSGVQGCSCRTTTPEHHLFARVGKALLSVVELEDKAWWSGNVEVAKRLLTNIFWCRPSLYRKLSPCS